MTSTSAAARNLRAKCATSPRSEEAGRPIHAPHPGLLRLMQLLTRQAAAEWACEQEREPQAPLDPTSRERLKAS